MVIQFDIPIKYIYILLIINKLNLEYEKKHLK